MGLIIAVVNNKGGVGKTTITGNLADALGRRGQTVLVVDMDTQGNVTSLLLPRGSSYPHSLPELLTPAGPGLPLTKFITPTPLDNVALIPHSPDSTSLEAQLLLEAPASFLRLRQALRDYARQHFDFTLIDNPPNMGSLVISALHAADGVIVPIKAGSSFSVEGLVKAVSLISDIRAGGNPDLRYLRLLVNHVDRRTSISQSIAREISGTFRDDQLFRTAIPVNTAFEQAESLGQTIIQFNPRAAGARAFQELAGEVEAIFGDKRRTSRRVKYDRYQGEGQASAQKASGQR